MSEKDSADPVFIFLAQDEAAHSTTASTTASSGVSRGFLPQLWRKDPGHHAEVRITIPPEASPAWQPPRELHGGVPELVFTFVAVGVLLWFLRAVPRLVRCSGHSRSPPPGGDAVGRA